ncbi:NUDIX domain-containing protein [Patescibacteria group bacterium]|nr:NUDIX domain-containing protein [Patescibacteria group bacterium]
MKHKTTDDLSEQFVVVDTRDHPLGVRTRYECHRDRRLIHRSVGVLIFDRQKKVLLQKRSLTKDLQPGLWAISAAGHVSAGETYRRAAERELFEELGIRAPIRYVGKWLFRDRRETEFDALYRGYYQGPFRTHPDEVAEVCFFSKRELDAKRRSKEVILSTWAVASLRHIGFITET